MFKLIVKVGFKTPERCYNPFDLLYPIIEPNGRGVVVCYITRAPQDSVGEEGAHKRYPSSAPGEYTRLHHHLLVEVKARSIRRRTNKHKRTRRLQNVTLRETQKVT